MIQELLGGVVDESKAYIPSSPLTPSSLTSSLCSSPSNSAPSAVDAGGQRQNLRCPRCDSSNTKFCYYNNYNLTQPRHFCKTCRRHWTKGGTLRNVPIGGGCRRTKAAAAPSGKGAHHKPMTSPMMPADVILGRVAGAGQELIPSGTVLWASRMPHGSHLLSWLMASQQLEYPNPNPLLNLIRNKDGGMMPTLDHQQQNHHLGQLVIGTNWMNESNQPQEIYQGPSSSTTNSEHSQLVGNNVGHAKTCSSSSAAVTTTSTTEPTLMTGNDLGCWDPAMMWTELSTANGALPLN